MFWFFIGLVMGVYIDQTFTVPPLQKIIDDFQKKRNSVE